MARTIDTIYNELLAAKADESSLDELTSTSNAAIWRLVLYVVAFAMNMQEQLRDVFKSEVESSLLVKNGNLKWYQAEILNWQFGDGLVWNGNGFEYSEIDETARLASQVSVTEIVEGSFPVLLVKAAKGEVGSLEALSESELSSLTTYVEQIKIAGTKVRVSSNDADLLKIYFDIYYDPLYDVSDVRANVEATITNYIQTLPFDSNLYLSKLTDEIQKVEGVNDVHFTSAAATFGAVPYTSFDRVYSSNAGYMIIDDNFPLSNSLTFIAE